MWTKNFCYEVPRKFQPTSAIFCVYTTRCYLWMIIAMWQPGNLHTNMTTRIHFMFVTTVKMPSKCRQNAAKIPSKYRQNAVKMPSKSGTVADNQFASMMRWWSPRSKFWFTGIAIMCVCKCVCLCLCMCVCVCVCDIFCRKMLRVNPNHEAPVGIQANSVGRKAIAQNMNLGWDFRWPHPSLII